MLTGKKIREYIETGRLGIEPYHPELVAQASIDLHLSEYVYKLRRKAKLNVENVNVKHFKRVEARPFSPWGGLGFWLKPGRLYIASTLESIDLPIREGEESLGISGILDGKSSEARLGIKIHFTAGYFEPGFQGPATMEMEVTNETFIPVGWPIAQMRFFHTLGEVTDYRKSGNYRDATSDRGPQLSRSYKHRRHPRWAKAALFVDKRGRMCDY